MDQDWKEITIRKKPPTIKEAIRSGDTIVVKKRSLDLRAKKLEHDNESVGDQERIPHLLATTIQQARSAKGMTRQELAQKLNVKTGVIAEYETGKAVVDHKLLQRMSTVLGVHLKK